MLSNSEIIQEIDRLKNTIIVVKKELKSVKNSVRAYKGWTKRYRKKQKELQQEAITLQKNCQIAQRERDRINQELNIKQQELVKVVAEAKKAKDARDKALVELDAVIAKIEEYRGVCDRANKMTYADKVYLIQKAEELFFDEEIIDRNLHLDSREKPQMFTDSASINRSLLDR